MKGIIIQGSARSKGNTNKINQSLMAKVKLDLLDLKTKEILPYDYSHDNAHDDFISVMKEIVDYELIIFSTPVYWYSMSGIMKNFLDRISDCLQTEKELGRKLRGKTLAAISCGSESSQVQGFFEPFKLSAEYLGMAYLGAAHTWISETEISPEVEQIIKSFSEQILR